MNGKVKVTKPGTAKKVLIVAVNEESMKMSTSDSDSDIIRVSDSGNLSNSDTFYIFKVSLINGSS